MDVRQLLAHLLRFVILIVAGSKLAMAGTTDPSTPDSKYVEFGKQFPAVARLRSVTLLTNNETGESKPTFQYGSAVIIKPNWILTAAHVVHGADEHVVIKDDDSKFPLQYVVVHKDFKDDDIGFHDLALGYSSKSFELPFYSPLYTKSDELGKAATIAGYGLHGTFHNGAYNSDGKKRAGHNRIDSAERAVLVATPSRANRFPLEFVIAPGDSGGGMFIGNELAGINSFLMAVDKKPDGTYGDEAAFTRVSLYVDWIHAQIEKYELAIKAQATLGAHPTPAQ
jgi:hypothetical protein